MPERRLCQSVRGWMVCLADAWPHSFSQQVFDKAATLSDAGIGLRRYSTLLYGLISCCLPALSANFRCCPGLQPSTGLYCVGFANQS